MNADTIPQLLEALRALPDDAQVTISIRVGSLARAIEGLQSPGPTSSEGVGGSGGRGTP